MRVTDDQGREWHGRIEAFAPDSLVLLTKDRQRRDIPYATIVGIDRPHDTLANGALIGFVSGAAFGMLAVIAEENADCEPAGSSVAAIPPRRVLPLPRISGAIGAGVGVGIDALIRSDPTLFRRGESRVTLAPSLGRGVRGVRLSCGGSGTPLPGASAAGYERRRRSRRAESGLASQPRRGVSAASALTALRPHDRSRDDGGTGAPNLRRGKLSASGQLSTVPPGENLTDRRHWTAVS